MRFLKNKIALSAQAKVEENTTLSETIAVKHEFEPVETLKIVKEEEYEPTNIHKSIIKEENEPIETSTYNYSRITTPSTFRTTKQSKEDARSTKTVVKNYGKAIASFAISNIAVLYLTPIVKEEKITLDEFTEYIGAAKETIEGIDTFRALLLVKSDDSSKLTAYKRVFGKIAEVFIKYFSVNWIFSGRMANKKVHLMMRFKMLRRIQNPELFTYLK